MPSDSQSDARAVELRPPRCRSRFRSGRRERPRPSRGVALFHTRRDDGRPAGPATVLFPSPASASIRLPMLVFRMQTAPPGWLRGRGGVCSLPVTAGGSCAPMRTPRPSRAGPSRPALPAHDCRFDGFCPSRANPVPSPCRRPATRRTAVPADSPRTTAAYRMRPRGPPVGQGSWDGWAPASFGSGSRSMGSGGAFPPVAKTKKEPRHPMPPVHGFRGPGPARASTIRRATGPESSGRDSQVGQH